MAVPEFNDASSLPSPPPREIADRVGITRDRGDTVVALNAARMGIAAHWARSMRG